MKNKLLILLALCTIVLMASGCADSEQVSECLVGHKYGFFSGIWHGIISPFALIGGMFSSDIAVWAPNNSGWWYSFGFLLGIGGFLRITVSVTKR